MNNNRYSLMSKTDFEALPPPASLRSQLALVAFGAFAFTGCLAAALCDGGTIVFGTLSIAAILPLGYGWGGAHDVLHYEQMRAFWALENLHRELEDLAEES